jgi:hypothetical protein
MEDGPGLDCLIYEKDKQVCLLQYKQEANKETNFKGDYALARGPPPLEKFLLLP